jgi:hypothetical protein
MVRRFKDPRLARLYAELRANPPKSAGRVLNDAFTYGRLHPDRPVPPIYGLKSSSQYVAWAAGVDHARAANV